MPSQRLILFIDNQTIYKNAREAFFSPLHKCQYGQINPIKLGNLICQRSSYNNVTLSQVRVYCGCPDSNRDPKSFRAHNRQRQFWEAMGVEVITRLLMYPPGYPNIKPREKGIDVALAVDFVAMAAEDAYDIGVMLSTDSDLAPALEYVYKYKPAKRINVVSWQSNVFRKRLTVDNTNIFCHHLTQDDYNLICDLTNYARQII